MSSKQLYSLFYVAASLVLAAEAVSVQTVCTNDGEFLAKDEVAIDHILHKIVDFNVTQFQAQCTAKAFLSFTLCEDGGWSEICDSNFTKFDATVMCRHLGYSDIGVQMYVYPQYIGTVKMSRLHPECNGYESSLTDCLVRHSISSEQCSARRVGVVCFPKSMDPWTDLPLCGLVVPSSLHLTTTTSKDGSLSTDSSISGHSATTSSPLQLSEHERLSDSPYGSLVASKSVSGFIQQKGHRIFVVVYLGVLTVLLYILWCV